MQISFLHVDRRLFVATMAAAIAIGTLGFTTATSAAAAKASDSVVTVGA
jgi:hypothetical protein